MVVYGKFVRVILLFHANSVLEADCQSTKFAKGLEFAIEIKMSILF